MYNVNRSRNNNIKQPTNNINGKKNNKIELLARQLELIHKCKV